MEEYRTEDLESELGIDREAMIRMALLLGSDYTEGAPGIGIVNALEIVRAFPTDESLKGFREWVDAPDAEALAAAQGKQAEIGEQFGMGLFFFHMIECAEKLRWPGFPFCGGLFKLLYGEYTGEETCQLAACITPLPPPLDARQDANLPPLCCSESQNLHCMVGSRGCL